MGVPKFFRWLSERYPLTVQRHGCRVKKETFLEHYDEEKYNEVTGRLVSPDHLSTCGLLPPVIDRLYIDMNGIIHGCSHNNQDDDASTLDGENVEEGPPARTEADVFRDICYYLDRIVRDIAQPKELLYLAIDGVAPRAKLNQQRARRYRSAKEGEIEQTVYDAHRQKLEEQQFGFDEDGGSGHKTWQERAGLMTDASLNMGSVGDQSSSHKLKEVEPGRFTGKFEAQTSSRGVATDSDSIRLEGSDADAKGEREEKFHSNMITPGTAFFQRCTAHLEHFIQRKISTDPAWQNLTVILSGSNTPGEGEHKIMQFMREQQALPDYEPNMRHCIMGQDGDLIMLGLATHEPNLFLLRERVIFDERRRQAIEKVSGSLGLGVYLHNAHFELLHMNVLRDYLALEFATSNVLDNSPYDLEHTIDDFVFMTFLVGNDFLPSLPALDIGDDAFDLLFYTYRSQRKKWRKEKSNGLPYLTSEGRIVSGHRLERFLSVVGSYESRWHDYKKSTTDFDELRRIEAKFGRLTTPNDEILEAKEASDRFRYRQLLIESAKSRKHISSPDFVPAMSNPDIADLDVEDEDDIEEQEGLLDRIGSLLHSSVQNDGKGSDYYQSDGKGGDGHEGQIDDIDFKGRYYADKFGFSPFDKEKHLELRRAYVEGLVWTLQYYYHKTASWEWYYPYHYGPMISDIVGVDNMLKEISFRGREGAPLKPYEQLMACMPASNAHILPKPYRWLMTEKSSPLQDFYPESFTVDMNGKRWPWEAVVLLPFIDAQRLRDEASKIDEGLLTKEEKVRNLFKEDTVFFRNETRQRLLPAVPAEGKHFGELADCTTVAEPITKTRWYFKPDENTSVPLFRPQVNSDVIVPLDGLPTLLDGSVLGMRRKALNVNVHGAPSRYHTSMIELNNDLPEVIQVETLAEQLIGKHVFVNYPHLIECFVTAVSDSRVVIRGKEPPKSWTPAEAAARRARVRSICRSYVKGQKMTGTGGLAVAGVNADEAEILLSVRPLKGIRVGSDGPVGKVFAKFEVEVPSFVTSWAPVRADHRLENLPRILEKEDPYTVSAGKIVGNSSSVIASRVMDRQYDSFPGDPPSDKPSVLKSARSFSTLANAQLSALPAALLHRKVAIETNLAKPLSSRRIHTTRFAAARPSRVPGPGRLLAVGALAATWFLSGVSAAISAFDEQSINQNGAFAPQQLAWESPTVSPQSVLGFNGRNAEQSVPPLEFAHGTTTLAFKFQGGIIVAVDSRASLGTFIGSKTVQKVLPIHPTMLGTMAGGAADCSFWIRKLAARAALFEAEEERRMPIARASRFLSSVLYSYRGAGLSMGTMIMGYDEDRHGRTIPVCRIFYVDDRGTRIEGDMFAVGSGSTYAIAILDEQENRYSLTTEEAVRLAVQAIRYATFRDGSSGGFINVYHISPGKEWKRVFRQDVASILEGSTSL